VIGYGIYVLCMFPRAAMAHQLDHAVRSLQADWDIDVCKVTHGTPNTCPCVYAGLEYVCAHATQPAAPSGAVARCPDAATDPAGSKTHCVINFYHLSEVSNPGQIAKEHKAYIQDNGWDIRGRIYISYQGINAQFSGPTAEAVAYTEWLAQQPAFQGMHWRSYAVDRNVFPRLKLKFKPNLISLQGGMESLPVVGARFFCATLTLCFVQRTLLLVVTPCNQQAVLHMAVPSSCHLPLS
jgi:UPF0176 acylphosphatase like domain